MSFAHCDHDETYLSLHDCLAERAYLKDGKLGFELHDGFWILPGHPENRLSQMVRTDASRVEYTLYRGESDDVTVYVFEKTFFKRTLRREWPLENLIENINTAIRFPSFSNVSCIFAKDLIFGSAPSRFL